MWFGHDCTSAMWACLYCYGLESRWVRQLRIWQSQVCGGVWQVHDYVKNYLGEGKKAREFAKVFLEKRSHYNNKARIEKRQEQVPRPLYFLRHTHTAVFHLSVVVSLHTNSGQKMWVCRVLVTVTMLVWKQGSLVFHYKESPVPWRREERSSSRLIDLLSIGGCPCGALLGMKTYLVSGENREGCTVHTFFQYQWKPLVDDV